MGFCTDIALGVERVLRCLIPRLLSLRLPRRSPDASGSARSGMHSTPPVCSARRHRARRRCRMSNIRVLELRAFHQPRGACARMLPSARAQTQVDTVSEICRAEGRLARKICVPGRSLTGAFEDVLLPRGAHQGDFAPPVPARVVAPWWVSRSAVRLCAPARSGRRRRCSPRGGRARGRASGSWRRWSAWWRAGATSRARSRT